MEAKDRIDEIIRAKREQGLSVQQLADMCQISASTVSRTLAGKTAPTDFTITAMEEALGITDNPIGEPIQTRAESDPILERYLNTQEVRINRMRAHYNMLLAEKNRWIILSFAINIILVLLICGILILDVLHPDIGWIREQLGIAKAGFWKVLFSFDWINSNICLNIL